MRHLLVTGAAGFIGANFVRYWLERRPDDDVLGLDALTYAGNRASLPPDGHPGFRFVHADILDEAAIERLMQAHAIDTIVHFAAESHVDRSIHGPDAFVRTNIVGTHALLKVARRVWLDGGDPGPRRFHHVSTDEVFGSLGPADPRFTEATPFAPNSPYAASKAAADHLVRSYHQTFGLPVTTTNCSNNYGPYQFPEKLIPLMLVNALEGRPLPVYGDGGNVRDWLFVTDHCRAIELALDHGRAGETYAVGGHNEWTNIAIVRLLCRLLDESFGANPALRRRFARCPAARGDSCERLIAFVADRLGHDRRYAIDAAKAERALGFVPQETFESGIGKTITWYLEHESWWRSVMDGSYRAWVEQHYGRESA